jgi:diguanylate cyclase (GGDEF)-like protein
MSERVRYSNLVIADSLEQQRKFQHHATIDALTGLHNRGWMNDVFAREIQRAEREELPLCLMMLDVDFFKHYNDNYGHLAGDRVLISVGEAAGAPLRTNDLFARYGGEEFSVLLPETKMEQAMIVAERLRQRIRDTDPGILDGVQLPKVTVSIGVAEYRPGQTLETLVAAADVAMYHAKNNGRNCVKIATDA